MAGALTDATDPRSRWSTDGGALYAVIACACVVAVWAPIAISLAHPVKLFDGWGVLSGYVGVAWVAPGALIGLAVSRLCREREVSYPNAFGAVAGVATLIALVIALAAWMTTVEGRWEDDGSASQAPQRVTEAPADLVRDAADEPVVDVLCRPISNGSFFCAATYEGPACQLFSVTGDHAKALPPVVDGASATRTDRGVRCST